MPRSNSRDPETNPAALLGQQLRRMRLAAGFSTQPALASRLGFGQDVVSKAETGAQPPSDDVLTRWLDICGATDREREMLADVLKLARKAHGPIPEFIEKWLKAERIAEFLRLWSFVAVPGLLQVREYAHAMYTRGGLDDDEAAEKATVRLERQTILDGQDPVHLTAIIYESVLHRLVGTPAIMVTQLTHLLEMSQRRNVVIQVVRDTGYFPGLRGQFEIASGDGMPDTLLMLTMEDQTSEDHTLTRKALALFEQIRGYALNVEDSRAFIMEAIERWKSQQ